MAIPITSLWKQTPHDLHAVRENAQAAQAILRMHPLVRRARMIEWGYPRFLYKYKDIPRDRTDEEKKRRKQLEDMLLKNELFASTVEKFNDPFDAQADYRIPERGDAFREVLFQYFRTRGMDESLARQIVSDDSLVSNTDAIAAEMKKNHQKLLQQLGICSLTATATDPLLWAHYTCSHCGIAVQYQPSLDPEALQPHKVEYSTAYPIIDNFFNLKERDIFSPLLRKSPSWSYEHEWRLLRPDEPNHTFQVRPEALTGVLLGMRISDADRDYIRALVAARDARHGLTTRVFQAEAAPGAYDVRFRRLL